MAVVILFLVSFSFSSCKSKPKSSSNTNTGSSSNQSATTQKDEGDMKFKSYYMNGLKQKALGNTELAEEMFREALKIQPENGAAHYELAGLLRYAGLYDDALLHARDAVKAEAKNEWFQLLYIECLHLKKYHNEAAAAYEKLISSHPNKRDYYMAAAEEHTYAGNYSKALKTYETAAKKFGQTPEIIAARLKILRAQGKGSDIEAELKKLIEQYPSESRYYTYLAEYYQENKQDEKAMQLYSTLSKIDPHNPYVHLALADFYRSRQNDSAFMRELKTAFKYPELNIDQKIMMLIQFFTISDQHPEYRPDGLALCEIVVNVHPDDPKAHAVYGDYLHRENRLKEARDQYLIVIEQDKGKFAVWEKVLSIDAEMREWNYLEKHAGEAAELFPSHPLPVYYNGEALLQLKKYQEGIDKLLEAKEYVVDDNTLLTQIYARLGDAYHYTQQYEKSDRAYEDALSITPDNVQVMNNYSYYLSLRKQKLERAESLSAKANELVKNNPQYLDTYAWILYQQNKLNAALEWMEKAIKNGGDGSGVIMEHYGDILFKLNKTEEAMEWWKKARQTGRHSENIDKKINEKKLYE